MYKDLKTNDTVNYMKIIIVGLRFRAQLQHNYVVMSSNTYSKQS